MLILITTLALLKGIRLIDLTSKYHSLLLEPTVELSEQLKEQLYEEYTRTFKKTPSTTRNQIFKTTLDEIVAHNKDNTKTWKKGITEFADMSHQEFAQYYTIRTPQNCSATVGTHQMSGKSRPDSVDWRQQGKVSDVKNQGHCGSCWTFSTTGSLEAHYRIYKNQPVLLSEQQLVDCAHKFDNHGCNGGLPSHAFEYIKYNGGIESEDNYPYKAETQDCKFNPDHIAAQVPYGSVNITALDEGELADAIAFKGPVSVAFQVITGFKDYRSGIYQSNDCKNGPMDVNHAVLAVGYGTDNGQPYYIVKNSWGTDWGMDGYFLILRDVNMCGIGNCNSYPNLGQALGIIDAQSLEI